ncbi:hypothetical protein DF185_23310 [Marinifilum breve]|uniref:Uncharacterized protein n=1 Tax=Marinifilum breve TaxID=2184082 RepID=A0A2V3ZK80_9BACT|nr:hypothetical protein DF185_23310 [Marinifilum breve]
MILDPGWSKIPILSFAFSRFIRIFFFFRFITLHIRSSGQTKKRGNFIEQIELTKKISILMRYSNK